jgi:phosphocarrier protein HPr
MVDSTVQASVVLTHAVGLHARPSVKLTKLAKTFDCTIRLALSAEGPWIDAKSIVKVMATKARKNSTLHFHATGPDAAEAVSALTSLVARDFDESPADAAAN